MGLEIDFSGVKDQDYQVIPEGVYNCAVYDVVIKTSKNSGKDYINWVFSIVDECDYKGRRVFNNTSLQPQALWKLKEVLDAIGVKADKVVELDLNSYIGKILKVKIGITSYNGSDTNEVEEVGPSNFKPKKPTDDIISSMKENKMADKDELPF